MSTTPLKIYLSDEQRRWIEKRSKEKKETLSRCVVSLIEEQMDEKSTDVLLRKITSTLDQVAISHTRKGDEMLALLHRTSVLLKEVFRESSANLYRLNSIIDEMPNSILVRQKVNEFVRGRETEVLERLGAFKEEVSPV
jgi:hypothetical protein